MKIIQKLRKFCEGDTRIDHIEVPNKMFYDILAEEKFKYHLREVRFLVRHSCQSPNNFPSLLSHTYSEIVVRPSVGQAQGILLNGKYPRHLDNYPTPEFPYGDGTTPAKGYGKSIVENMTPSCDHEFVNIGFSTLKMVCKKCDKEQI